MLKEVLPARSWIRCQIDRRWLIERIAIIVAIASLVFSQSGCAVEPPRGPSVKITTTDVVSSDHYDAAIEIWAALGFRGVGEYALPACERNWYEIGNVDCVINAYLMRGDTGPGRLGYTLREETLIVLSPALTGDTLTWAAAHELGHILLNTGAHSEYGVMSGQFSLTVSTADVALACESIGVCL